MTTTPDRSAARGPRARVAHFVRRLFEHVPASVGGDLQRLPAPLTLGITGPFNGMRQRTAAVAAMFAAISFGTVIETGTYRALTTRHLSTLTRAPIATIEVIVLLPLFPGPAGRAAPGRTSSWASRRPCWSSCACDPAWQAQPVFFYLDAHWLHDLPLLDELAAVRRGWTRFVGAHR